MADQPIQPTPIQSGPTSTPSPQPVPDRIHVMVRNRRQLVFEDDVKAITSKNDTGVFDVLPEHSNFISVLKESITLHKLDGTKQVITLQNGLIKVKNSSVKCYIDLLSAEINKMQK
jgi:F0F1-type ATP synthase epsilon subunit